LSRPSQADGPRVKKLEKFEVQFHLAYNAKLKARNEMSAGDHPGKTRVFIDLIMQAGIIEDAFEHP
jgi:hypothetical protein